MGHPSPYVASAVLSLCPMWSTTAPFLSSCERMVQAFQSSGSSPRARGSGSSKTIGVAETAVVARACREHQFNLALGGHSQRRRICPPHGRLVARSGLRRRPVALQEHLVALHGVILVEQIAPEGPMATGPHSRQRGRSTRLPHDFTRSAP